MLGLLPAILSQTRRALTKILRLDTDYTTARATKIDDIDSTVSTNLDTTVSSRLADSDAVARVQTGLDNNGYTSGRASNLDNLNATVSSRSVPIGLPTRVSSTYNGGTFAALINDTGSGRLNGLIVESGSRSWEVKITIDGVNHGTYGSGGGGFYFDYNASTSDTLFQIVAGTDKLKTLDIFYRSSLLIEIRQFDAGTDNTFRAQYERGA